MTIVRFVTGHADIALAVEAIGSGAFDFVEKPFEAEVLIGLVRAALDPQFGSSAIELTKKDVEERIATFTDPERQVFERLVQGHSNGALARDLGLTERSIEIHRANVMTKMGASNLSKLVRMALNLKRTPLPASVSLHGHRERDLVEVLYGRMAFHQ